MAAFNRGLYIAKWTSAGLTTATTAYTSGDVLGVEATVPVGTGVSRGYIVNSTLIDAAAVLGAVDLFIFNAPSTPAADNGANSWSDANILNLVTIVQLTSVYASALNKVVDTGPAMLRKPFESLDGNLYVVAVTRTANTFFGAATDINYKFSIETSA